MPMMHRVRQEYCQRENTLERISIVEPVTYGRNPLGSFVRSPKAIIVPLFSTNLPRQSARNRPGLGVCARFTPGLSGL
jgi:hypothetical protein